MEKIINSYECMFIINPDLGEDAIAALIEKFKAIIEESGTIDTLNEWGRRKLAYPINDLPDGYYVLVNFKAAPELPLELERVFNITDGIMRSLVIRQD